MAATFAHAGLKSDRSDWHPLRYHLRGTAALAEERAAKFCAASLGRLCGLLYDLGKDSNEFRARLRGATTSVEHSARGTRCGTEVPASEVAIAYVIAGHHAGLANGTGDGDPTSLEPRSPAARAGHVEKIALVPRHRSALLPLASCAHPSLATKPGQPSYFIGDFGAGEGNRTLDTQLGKLMFCH